MEKVNSKWLETYSLSIHSSILFDIPLLNCRQLKNLIIQLKKGLVLSPNMNRFITNFINLGYTTVSCLNCNEMQSTHMEWLNQILTRISKFYVINILWKCCIVLFCMQVWVNQPVFMYRIVLRRYISQYANQLQKHFRRKQTWILIFKCQYS